MKKFLIQTKVAQEDGSMTPAAYLEPNIHRPLYEIDAMQKAIQFLRDVPEAEGVWIRIGTRAFAITVYEGDRPDVDKYSFKLETLDEDT
jgi:hypothetical protein